MIRWSIAIAALGLVATACAGTGSNATDAPVLSGFERTPTPSVSGASLPEVTNDDQSFRFEAQSKDGLLLVYFGFTHCPDVCPTTLADLRAALDQLDPSERSRIETAMVTVDPDRDTADVLPNYVRSFLPDAAALRTESDAELRATADAFGVTYEVTETATGVEVIHTGSLYAVAPNGDLLISWPFGVTPEDLNKDLRILLGRVSA